jgi:hypothetical protein
VLPDTEGTTVKSILTNAHQDRVSTEFVMMELIRIPACARSATQEMSM